jgi:hypothetical protein
MDRYEILSIIGSAILSAFVFHSVSKDKPVSEDKPKVQYVSFKKPPVIEIKKPIVITVSKNK